MGTRTVPQLVGSTVGEGVSVGHRLQHQAGTQAAQAQEPVLTGTEARKKGSLFTEKMGFCVGEENGGSH